MLINPGSDRPQGPWDPDAKRKWVDLQYFWVLLPLLLVMIALIAANYAFGS